MFLINARHWIHSGGPTFTPLDLFLTAIDRAKERVRKFFSMNNFFSQNIRWRTMNNILGTRIMKFQYIAPIFWTFASECILIQIIGKNKQLFMLSKFWLTLYFVFINMISFKTFCLFWFWLSKFELHNFCLQNYSITRIYNFSIIYMTDCLLTRRICILRTIKISTTILIVWEGSI